MPAFSNWFTNAAMKSYFNTLQLQLRYCSDIIERHDRNNPIISTTLGTKVLPLFQMVRSDNGSRTYYLYQIYRATSADDTFGYKQDVGSHHSPKASY